LVSCNSLSAESALIRSQDTSQQKGELMEQQSRPRFHLAVPVHDLSSAEAFYGDVLGCPRGRRSDISIDWDMHGHQVVTHLVKGRNAEAENAVDGRNVPVPHFGLLLSVGQFQEMAERLRAAGTEFIVEP
jgi:extradiol dioxygenase family protein